MKFALVTGGTGSIGACISKDLLISGYKVIACYYKDENKALSFKQGLDQSLSQNLFLVQYDLSDLSVVNGFVEKIREITDKLDEVVFCAGATDRSEFDDITIDNWLMVFNTNINVPFFVLKGLVRHFQDLKNAVFIGSVMGVQPHSSSLSYGVSKSAVHSLVRNLVKSLSSRKIRVNAVVPGFISGEWHESKSEGLMDAICLKIGLGKFGKPENVSKSVLFIIENDYVNGELIVIDGGYNYF
jgi:3-oxoacyl-[acyl-carrier protein] reductase